MSAGPICKKCGDVNRVGNRVGAKFCSECGGPLIASMQPSGEIGATVSVTSSIRPPSPAYDYTAYFPDQRTREIGRTKTGLLLIMVGILLAPLPYVNYLGSLLAIVGAILVIIGRKAFGAAHSRNTIWSIVIYCLGIAIVIGAYVGFASDVTSASITNAGGPVSSTLLAQTLSLSFEALLVGAAVGGAIVGLAHVLFTYAIQNRNGRILLWCAYAASIAVSIVEFSIIGPLISNAAAQSFTGSTYDPAPFSNLQSQLQAVALLGFIPAGIYATAFYSVWSRLDNSGIPSTVEQPPKLSKPGPMGPFGKPHLEY